MERREWRGVGQALPTVTKTLAGMFIVQDNNQRLVAAFVLKKDCDAAVVNHNQHATLVEQRDLLVSALRETIPHLDCNCYRARGRDCVKGKVEHVLATVEQGEGQGLPES